MATAMQHSVRERVGGAVSAALIHALIGMALLWGLGAPIPAAVERSLKLFDVAPPPPPPEPVLIRPPPPVKADQRMLKHSPREEGAASPPNLRSKATEMVAPTPVVRLPVHSPVIAAPKPGTGSDASSGAAEIRGPGTGAGGFGNGSGSGAGGNGDGGGGGGYDDATPPRLLRGRIRNSDYPPGAGEAGISGTVGLRYTVTTQGRVVNCRVTRSSGHSVLDELTCRLIEQRFRFDPSRDWRGRPIQSDIVENQSWIVEDDPADPEPRRTRRRRGIF